MKRNIIKKMEFIEVIVSKINVNKFVYMKEDGNGACYKKSDKGKVLLPENEEKQTWQDIIKNELENQLKHPPNKISFRRHLAYGKRELYTTFECFHNNENRLSWRLPIKVDEDLATRIQFKCSDCRTYHSSISESSGETHDTFQRMAKVVKSLEEKIDEHLRYLSKHSSNIPNTSNRYALKRHISIVREKKKDFSSKIPKRNNHQ
ncbi:CLUMA_CG016190, isoform A [Clunio marinus]|uniref:CLUMA_CG016190, isoform A n=1 Tax=Clunio marinus TaxID=568069 RepID=A0A1J1IS74_9DIPT|nr:CLUMA_CG016190, isoform A [Clunio marinus]